MKWIICTIFCSFLTAGSAQAVATKKETSLSDAAKELGATAKSMGSFFADSSITDGTVPDEQGLKVGDISISKKTEKAVSYEDERERQHQAGSQSQAVVSASGAAYAELGQERLNAESRSKLAQASKQDTKVSAGQSRYHRTKESQLEEEERRRLALARDHQQSAHVSAHGAGAQHTDREAISAEQERLRREKERDRTKWSAGSAVSITTDQEKLSEEELKRRAQSARESQSSSHTGSGVSQSESTRLSQEELKRKLQKLNETKDLRAGQARLVYRKHGAQKSQNEADRRDEAHSGQYRGIGGAVDHKSGAHSAKDGREDSRSTHETVELSAGNKVGLNQTLKTGGYDKYGRQLQRVHESTAAADGIGRVIHTQNKGQSGSQSAESKRDNAREQQVGIKG